ncbi:terminase small subunit [Sutcliffiella sp. NC1]|uniref:terminase small subunit n=1 Tax=Sutcliffiella sp. NC1 TaxID=3004096 RepID=UPI0022DD08D3|nr:terminase small subunit [Sutcliffiella sp. NC1]WBL16439.1 terminase small subunit [Sutcliffiella sp. NC1]
MARARSPNRDKAFEMWKESGGKLLLKDIAAELRVKDSQIRKWKNQDKWDEQLKGNVTKSKSNVTNKKVPKKEKNIDSEEVFVESDNLTDKQRLFCMYYLKYFNATKAYQKAYGCAYSTAMVEGHRHLRNPKISQEIERQKEEQTNELKLDAKHVLQKYIDIAFADITDYATFGKKEVEAMGPFGPMKDEDGNIMMVEINYVDFMDSTEIDGTIVTEVKKGKDGVSVKLADKMKALDFLAKYTDLLNEEDRKKLQDEKIKTEIAKTQADTEFAKMRASKLRGDRKDTSMLESLIEGRKKYEEMIKERENDG